MVMKQVVIALAALAASAFVAPASYALDCDPDDVSEIAECMESILKIPSMMPDMPKAGGRGMSRSEMMEQCGAENDRELKECIREAQE
jgi:hypothetical protein